MLTYENLTNEELAASAQNGDEKALEELIKKNEGLAVFLALKFLWGHGFNDCFSTGLIEDYKQLCRIAVWKSAGKYDQSSGIKFSTYAGRAMWNSMIREFARDFKYRDHVIKTIEEEDSVSEEVDEEYGDGYDNTFEDRKGIDIDFIFKSARTRLAEINNCAETDIELAETEFEKEQLKRLGAYFLILDGIKKFREDEKNDFDFENSEVEQGADEFNDTGLEEDLSHKPQGDSDLDKSSENNSDPKTNRKKVYLNSIRNNYSWEYPVYHEVIRKMQTDAAVNILLGESFDSVQQEFMVYLYGFEDGEPKTLKDAAEYFNLSMARARKIENEGLKVLVERMREKRLM